MNAKILLVNHAAICGGAATMVANTAKALVKAGFCVTVLCPPGDGLEFFCRAGAEVQTVPRALPILPLPKNNGLCFQNFFFLASYFSLIRGRRFWTEYFRDCGADVIGLCSLVLAPMAGSVFQAGIPSVCIVQETQSKGWLGIRNAYLRRILSEKITGLSFISNYDRCAWNVRVPVENVIPNWIDLAVFRKGVNRREARQRLGLTEDNQVVLFLGGVAEIKGTLPLLLAIRELKDMKQLRLVIAGYGAQMANTGLNDLLHFLLKIRSSVMRQDYRRRVLDLIGQPDLAEKVLLTGPSDDVASLYAAADIVAFPAVRPHQGRPILEAGAMGVPVVASDFNCLYEFVRDGETGLLVRANDPVSISKAIKHILMDASLAHRLGRGNAEVTRRYHNAAINGPQMAALFQAVLERHKRSCS